MIILANPLFKILYGLEIDQPYIDIDEYPLSCLLILSSVNYIIIFFQEAQNPPRPGEGGRQLGKDDARRTNLMNWLSRCSIL